MFKREAIHGNKKSIPNQDTIKDLDVESVTSGIYDGAHRGEGFISAVWIQFDPIFHTFVQLGIYICVLGVIIDYIFATNVDKRKYDIPDIQYCRLTIILYTSDILFILDVILMILYRHSKNMDILENIYYSRHPLILLVEIISIIPLEFVYYHMSEREMTMFAALRLRYVLRITRFISIFKNKSVSRTSVAFQLLLHILIIFAITASISAYFYKQLCEINSCDYAEWSKLIEIFIKLLNALMHVNLDVKNHNEVIYREVYICLVWIGYFYAIYLRCYFTCLCVEMKSKQSDYVIEMKRDLELLQTNSLNEDKLANTVIKNFYNVQWRKGMSTDIYKNRSYLPDIVIREIKLDTRWNGLKHTRLFRNQSVHFLRHLSTFVKIKYLHGGEVIYRRGSKKLYMIYIMMGNVHMICGNGETPMISFSRGTVFGETSLYVPLIASNTVVSQGYCQIFFLYREDYINIRFKYPEIYKALQKEVINRLAKAKLYNDIVRHHNEKLGIDDLKASLSIKYVKHTLSALLGVNDIRTQLNQTWSLSHKRFDQLRPKTAFCAKYLDMYVLTSDSELITNSNLEIELTSTLHPDSMLITMGEKLIVCLSVIYYVIIMAYVCFPLERHSYFFYVLIYFLTMIWVCDIIMQCSIRFVSRDVIYTKRTDIFFHCLTKATFYVDLISALPAEFVFFIMDGDLRPRVKKLFYLNRLLKVYRVFRYFRNFDKDTIAKLSLKENLKYGCYALLLCYGIVCLYTYYYEGAWEDVMNVDYFVLQAARTLSIITGVSFEKTKLADDILWLAIILQLIVFASYNYVFAMIAASTSMHTKSYQRFHEIMHHATWSTTILDQDIQLRISQHFRLHSMYKQGLYLLDMEDCFSSMSDELKVFSKQIVYSGSLKEAAFLKYLAPGLFLELYDVCTLVIIPAGEVLYYANETATEIFIVKAGYCQSGTGDRDAKLYKTGDSLNVLPCFMESTSVDTVGTLTAVQCIVLPYDKLKNAMNTYDPSIIRQIKECMQFGQQLDRVRTEADSYFRHTAEREPSIIVNVQNKYYHKGFPPNLGFLKSLLLLVTFPPHGKFAFHWEIARTLITLLNVWFTTVPAAFSYQLSGDVAVLLLCDLFSFIDLYIQHHICFFNRFSLLVYHPYSTAKHYWQHGFCLDLFSVLPFGWIYFLVTKQNASLLTASILRINRYLQFIRVYKFTNYTILKYSYYDKYILMIRWVIFAIYLIQIFTFFFLMAICEFSWGDTTYFVKCSSDSLVETVLNQYKSFSTHFLSLIGFHIVSIVYCNRNIQEEVPVVTLRVLIMQLQALIGLLMYIAISANVIAHAIFSHSGLITHQVRMKNLVNFMSGRMEKTVQKEIIDYFEYIWMKTGGNNLNESMRIFNTSLRMDSLYNVYGRVLKYSGIFPHASKSFIKSFMMHISHEYYRNRGVISRVNDIHGMIYIVFKGTVEVLGPDFNRLLTLGPGSIFGNLDNISLVRQTLTMVANGHVEVLSIPSITFYDVLSKYPLYLKHFKRHTMVHVDYIKTIDPDNALFCQSASSLSRSSRQSKGDHSMYNCCTRIRRRNTFIKLWDPIIINVTYILSANIESFCMITTTHNIFAILFAYIFDLIAIFNMYLKFHTVIRDDFGFVVLNRTKISETYRKTFFGFYLELLATVPFELIALIFINHEYFYVIFHVMRFNRLLRIVLVFKVTLQAKQKLNVNVYIIRILSTLTWVNGTFCMLSILMALVVLPSHGMPCDHASFSSEFKFFITTTLNMVKLNNGVTVKFHVLVHAKWYSLLSTSTIVLVQRFIIDVVFLSQICATMQILRSNHTKYKKYVTWLEKFLLVEYVSLPLYKRILEYAKLLWLYQNGVQFPSLLNEAPYYIREAVLNSIFGFHLREHYVFKDCHTDFLRQVAASIKCTNHFRGDVICFVGDIDECMYIIHEGKVAALTEDSLYEEAVHTTLGKGEIFGIRQALFKKTGHDYTYKALEYTVILTLPRSEFVDLITFFPASKFVIYKAIEETV